MFMKQMKFLLVALMTVLMGMSVTSCMNGDDKTIYTGPAFAKCVSTYPAATFELANGQRLVVNELMMADLIQDNIYFFYYQFDTAQQPANSQTLNVTLYAGSTPTSISAKSTEGPEKAADYNEATAPLYTFNSDTSTQPGILFNEYLVIPIMYWVKVESTDEKQKEELNKHSFILTYDFTNVKSGDTTLELTLNHVIKDGSEETVDRNKYTSTYKAYNLTTAISAFKTASGGTEPTKIKVNAKTNSSKNSLDGAANSTWSETLKTN